MAGGHYFASEELSEKPQFLREREELPAIFLPDIVPAPTVAYVLINETGHVDQVILQESFLSEAAKQYIQAYFGNMIFSPGRIGELDVKSRMQIIIRLDALLPLHP